MTDVMKKHVIVVGHGSAALDYTSDFIWRLENLRFRTEELLFKVAETLENEAKLTQDRLHEYLFGNDKTL